MGRWPAGTPCTSRLARLAQVEGDTAAAIDAFATAARLAPNEPAVHKELAGALRCGRRGATTPSPS